MGKRKSMANGGRFYDQSFSLKEVENNISLEYRWAAVNATWSGAVLELLTRDLDAQIRWLAFCKLRQITNRLNEGYSL